MKILEITRSLENSFLSLENYFNSLSTGTKKLILPNEIIQHYFHDGRNNSILHEQKYSDFHPPPIPDIFDGHNLIKSPQDNSNLFQSSELTGELQQVIAFHFKADTVMGDLFALQLQVINIQSHLTSITEGMLIFNI